MALTIRESFFTGHGIGQVGTLLSPLAVEVDLSRQEGMSKHYPLRLGFEATPSTQYLGFQLNAPASIRVIRSSDDPYIVHVAAGLIGPDDTRAHGEGSGPLIHTPNGDSGWRDLENGFWWIAVALGMPIDVRFDLEICFRPQRIEASTDIRGTDLNSFAYGQYETP